MKRLSVPVVAILLLAAACTKNSTSATTTPATANPTFTAALSPANEVPPVTNAESGVSGTANITFVTTKDASGAITSATATAVVTLSGFPAGSTITNAHIHTGAAGVGGGVFIPFVPTANIPTVNGAASFTQTSNVTGDQLTTIVNNPAGFYFNVHTTVNPGGAIRNQLLRTQ